MEKISWWVHSDCIRCLQNGVLSVETDLDVSWVASRRRMWRGGGSSGGEGKATVNLKDKKINGRLEAGRGVEIDDRHRGDKRQKKRETESKWDVIRVESGSRERDWEGRTTEVGYDWRDLEWIEVKLGQGRRENGDNEAERREKEAGGRGKMGNERVIRRKLVREGVMNTRERKMM
ncbi:hypothetical protein NQZ68_033780 [Dissostichus eleginoides]|nr:hypothetical protein NQZ68_033780 [Dissostichus eleginoides]